jgi:hypothetical protein
MKRSLVRAVAMVVLFWAANVARPSGAAETAQPGQRVQEQMGRLSVPSPFHAVVFPFGVAAAVADEYTGEVTAMAIRGGKDPSRAYVEFHIHKIINSVTRSSSNITITATIEVVNISANTEVHLTCYWVQGNTSGGMGGKWISAPGTYTITSAPFFMSPGKEYRGSTAIEIQPMGDNLNGKWVRAVVKSIKFNL